MEKEIQKYGLAPDQILRGHSLEDTIHSCGFNTLDSLMMSIGYGKTSLSRVVEKLLPRDQVRERESLEVPVKPPSRKAAGNPIRVKNFDDDVLIRMGKCCNPLPGDPIVGYITRGRGISVHHSKCPSVASLGHEAERMLEVMWDTLENATFATRVSIVSVEKQGQLARISQALAECEVNIIRANVQLGAHKRAYFDLTVEIRDLTHLERTFHKLRKVEGVLYVDRVQEFGKKLSGKEAWGKDGEKPASAKGPGILIN